MMDGKHDRLQVFSPYQENIVVNSVSEILSKYPTTALITCILEKAKN